jgi:hypothetical protein
MKRLLLALALCALAVATVSAATGDARISWQAKYDTGDGTLPLRGYVQYATFSTWGGWSPWQTAHLDATGAALITLPLPVVCWSGTDICATLDGQWLYWTLVPWRFGDCTPLDPSANSATYRGVDWIAEQDISRGFVFQGECQP